MATGQAHVTASIVGAIVLYFVLCVIDLKTKLDKAGIVFGWGFTTEATFGLLLQGSFWIPFVTLPNIGT